MSATSTTRRAALVAANGRARRPAEPPQGDFSHAEVQRGGERRDCCQCENVANTQSQYPIGTGNTSTTATFSSLPNGWEVRPLRAFLRSVSVRNRPDEQLLSVTREEGVIVRDVSSKEENHNYIPEDLSNYKFVEEGQFVINKMKSWQGSYGVSAYDGLVSPAYFVYDLDFPCKEFFNLAIRSKTYVQYFQRFSKGIRVDQWDLMPEALKLIPFAYPPLPEQKAIVAYLDAETGRIDKAIAAEEKMIALLQERREIVINEAVGECCQCENVANAQSQYPIGTGNIGTGNTSTMATFACLPKGWGVKKVKQCAIIEHGSDPKTEGDIPVYGSGAESFKTCGEFKEGPTVLLGRKGATLHIPHYVEGRFWNVDTAFNVYAKPNLNLRYFYYCATCFDYKRYMSQTTLPSMTQRDYANMPILLPPLPEQEAIVERLDRETGKIDRAIEVKRRQIELLRERRQIVIDEVVTGKVKVA